MRIVSSRYGSAHSSTPLLQQHPFHLVCIITRCIHMRELFSLKSSSCGRLQIPLLCLSTHQLPVCRLLMTALKPHMRVSQHDSPTKPCRSQMRARPSLSLSLSPRPSLLRAPRLTSLCYHRARAPFCVLASSPRFVSAALFVSRADSRIV